MTHRSNAVHVGRDGWLFLVGGTNQVLRQYRATPLAAWRLWRWRRLIERRASRAAALGLRFHQVVVPEKISIYEDRLDGIAVDPALSPARRLGLRMARSPAAGCWIDLVGPMRAARGEDRPLYLRTDTHWTERGCQLAYAEIMRGLGATPRPDLAERPYQDTAAVLDLGQKLASRPVETARMVQYQRDASRVEANALLETFEAQGRAMELHVGARAVFRNEGPQADPRRLVLFGDSCAHFGGFFLTGLLAESFREVHFVWSASIDWGYVERVRPHLLLVEMAERFLGRLPDDRFDSEAFAREKLKAAGA
ncbi:alginate O-acetyltransferase AlgX-related protein [Methylobacterium sp. ID0610]|uniref:alginate O-acetyltransferase AlgX-related protein n=1 Tax=Methylobacterium carpenticola TaxID=3344827 RepID=UPI00367B4109